MTPAKNGELYFCMDGGASGSRGRFVDIEGKTLFAAGGLVSSLRLLLSEKTKRPVLEPSGDALTGCWLVATGRAPKERALLFGETVDQAQ